MMRSASVLVLAATILAGCSGSASPTDRAASIGPSASASTSASGAAAGVICEAFKEGGPVDSLREAVSAAIRDENEAAATREAIEGFTDLASRASGGEADDLLLLAEAMDTAALSGEGYLGWSDAYEAFYVKYAEACGEPVSADSSPSEELPEGEFTKTLLLEGEPLEICLPDAHDLAERVVSEPVWSRSDRLRASDYLTWWDANC